MDFPMMLPNQDTDSGDSDSSDLPHHGTDDLGHRFEENDLLQSHVNEDGADADGDSIMLDFGDSLLPGDDWMATWVTSPPMVQAKDRDLGFDYDIDTPVYSQGSVHVTACQDPSGVDGHDSGETTWDLPFPSAGQHIIETGDRQYSPWQSTKRRPASSYGNSEQTRESPQITSISSQPCTSSENRSLITPIDQPRPMHYTASVDQFVPKGHTDVQLSDTERAAQDQSPSSPFPFVDLLCPDSAAFPTTASESREIGQSYLQCMLNQWDEVDLPTCENMPTCENTEASSLTAEHSADFSNVHQDTVERKPADTGQADGTSLDVQSEQGRCIDTVPRPMHETFVVSLTLDDLDLPADLEDLNLLMTEKVDGHFSHSSDHDLGVDGLNQGGTSVLGNNGSEQCMLLKCTSMPISSSMNITPSTCTISGQASMGTEGGQLVSCDSSVHRKHHVSSDCGALDTEILPCPLHVDDTCSSAVTSPLDQRVATCSGAVSTCVCFQDSCDMLSSHVLSSLSADQFDQVVVRSAEEASEILLTRSINLRLGESSVVSGTNLEVSACHTADNFIPLRLPADFLDCNGDSCNSTVIQACVTSEDCNTFIPVATVELPSCTDGRVSQGGVLRITGDSMDGPLTERKAQNAENSSQLSEQENTDGLYRTSLQCSKKQKRRSKRSAECCMSELFPPRLGSGQTDEREDWQTSFHVHQFRNKVFIYPFDKENGHRLRTNTTRTTTEDRIAAQLAVQIACREQSQDVMAKIRRMHIGKSVGRLTTGQGEFYCPPDYLRRRTVRQILLEAGRRNWTTDGTLGQISTTLTRENKAVEHTDEILRSKHTAAVENKMSRKIGKKRRAEDMTHLYDSPCKKARCVIQTEGNSEHTDDMLDIEQVCANSKERRLYPETVGGNGSISATPPNRCVQQTGMPLDGRDGSVTSVESLMESKAVRNNTVVGAHSTVTLDCERRGQQGPEDEISAAGCVPWMISEYSSCTTSHCDGNPVDDSHCDGSPLDDSHCHGSPQDDSHCDGSPPDDSHCDGSPPDDSHCYGSPPDDNHCHGSPPDDSHCHGSPQDDSHCHRSPQDDSHCHRSPQDDSHRRSQDDSHRSPVDDSQCLESPQDDSHCHGSPPDDSHCHGSPQDDSHCHGSPQDDSHCHGSLPDDSHCHGSPQDDSYCHRSPQDGSHSHRSPVDDSQCLGSAPGANNSMDDNKQCDKMQEVIENERDEASCSGRAMEESHRQSSYSSGSVAEATEKGQLEGAVLEVHAVRSSPMNSGDADNGFPPETADSCAWSVQSVYDEDSTVIYESGSVNAATNCADVGDTEAGETEMSAGGTEPTEHETLRLCDIESLPVVEKDDRHISSDAIHDGGMDTLYQNPFVLVIHQPATKSKPCGQNASEHDASTEQLQNKNTVSTAERHVCDEVAEGNRETHHNSLQISEVFSIQTDMYDNNFPSGIVVSSASENIVSMESSQLVSAENSCRSTVPGPFHCTVTFETPVTAATSSLTTSECHSVQARKNTQLVKSAEQEKKFIVIGQEKHGDALIEPRPYYIHMKTDSEACSTESGGVCITVPPASVSEDSLTNSVDRRDSLLAVGAEHLAFVTTGDCWEHTSVSNCLSDTANTSVTLTAGVGELCTCGAKSSFCSGRQDGGMPATQVLKLQGSADGVPMDDDVICHCSPVVTASMPATQVLKLQGSADGVPMDDDVICHCSPVVTASMPATQVLKLQGSADGEPIDDDVICHCCPVLTEQQTGVAVPSPDFVGEAVMSGQSTSAGDTASPDLVSASGSSRSLFSLSHQIEPSTMYKVRSERGAERTVGVLGAIVSDAGDEVSPACMWPASINKDSAVFQSQHDTGRLTPALPFLKSEDLNCFDISQIDLPADFQQSTSQSFETRVESTTSDVMWCGDPQTSPVSLVHKISVENKYQSSVAVTVESNVDEKGESPSTLVEEQDPLALWMEKLGECDSQEMTRSTESESRSLEILVEDIQLLAESLDLELNCMHPRDLHSDSGTGQHHTPYDSGQASVVDVNASRLTCVPLATDGSEQIQCVCEDAGPENMAVDTDSFDELLQSLSHSAGDNDCVHTTPHPPSTCMCDTVLCQNSSLSMDHGTGPAHTTKGRHHSSNDFVCASATGQLLCCTESSHVESLSLPSSEHPSHFASQTSDGHPMGSCSGCLDQSGIPSVPNSSAFNRNIIAMVYGQGLNTQSAVVSSPENCVQASLSGRQADLGDSGCLLSEQLVSSVNLTTNEASSVFSLPSCPPILAGASGVPIPKKGMLPELHSDYAGNGKENINPADSLKAFIGSVQAVNPFTSLPAVTSDVCAGQYQPYSSSELTAVTSGRTFAPCSEVSVKDNQSLLSVCGSLHTVLTPSLPDFPLCAVIASESSSPPFSSAWPASEPSSTMNVPSGVPYLLTVSPSVPHQQGLAVTAELPQPAMKEESVSLTFSESASTEILRQIPSYTATMSLSVKPEMSGLQETPSSDTSVCPVVTSADQTVEQDNVSMASHSSAIVSRADVEQFCTVNMASVSAVEEQSKSSEHNFSKSVSQFKKSFQQLMSRSKKKCAKSSESESKESLAACSEYDLLKPGRKSSVPSNSGLSKPSKLAVSDTTGRSKSSEHVLSKMNQKSSASIHHTPSRSKAEISELLEQTSREPVRRFSLRSVPVSLETSTSRPPKSKPFRLPDILPRPSKTKRTEQAFSKCKEKSKSALIKSKVKSKSWVKPRCVKSAAIEAPLVVSNTEAKVTESKAACVCQSSDFGASAPACSISSSGDGGSVVSPALPKTRKRSVRRGSQVSPLKLTALPPLVMASDHSLPLTLSSTSPLIPGASTTLKYVVTPVLGNKYHPCPCHPLIVDVGKDGNGPPCIPFSPALLSCTTMKSMPAVAACPRELPQYPHCVQEGVYEYSPSAADIHAVQSLYSRCHQNGPDYVYKECSARFFIQMLTIGDFTLDIGDGKYGKNSKVCFTFMKRMIWYKLELTQPETERAAATTTTTTTTTTTPPAPQIVTTEIDMKSIVGMWGTDNKLLLELNVAPQMHIGVKWCRNPRQPIDISGGQIKKVPYHFITFQSSCVKTFKRYLCQHPFFCHLLVRPVLVDLHRTFSSSDLTCRHSGQGQDKESNMSWQNQCVQCKEGHPDSGGQGERNEGSTPSSSGGEPVQVTCGTTPGMAARQSAQTAPVADSSGGKPM